MRQSVHNTNLSEGRASFNPHKRFPQEYWRLPVFRTASAATLLCFASLSTVLADPAKIEEKLLSENQAKGINTTPAAPVDDLGFARRICLDLVGRIPTGKEIKTFLSWPEEERRQG